VSASIHCKVHATVIPSALCKFIESDIITAMTEVHSYTLNHVNYGYVGFLQVCLYQLWLLLLEYHMIIMAFMKCKFVLWFKPVKKIRVLEIPTFCCNALITLVFYK